MKKVMKNVIVVLLILTLSAATALLTYLHFFASDDGELTGEQNLSGEWIANLDMTERAAVTALGWLQDIEAVSVSLEDMEHYMQGLTVRVNLTLEQTALSEGTFCCNVLPESYDACNQAAYEAFAKAFQALLTERLLMAGYTGSTDEETVEAFVIETFGMPTVSYLMSCGPALLPSLEALQAEYDGSGTYETAEGILIRQFESGSAAARSEYYIRSEYYVRKDLNLILLEAAGSDPAGSFSDHYPMVYTLKQPQEQ